MKKDCSPCVDKGILTIRVGIGLLMTIHGASIVFGGQQMRDLIGTMILGTSGLATVAGLVGGLVMFLGGLAFVLGLFFSVASALLAVTMIVAALAHFLQGQALYELGGPWHAVNLAILFIGFVGIGPGYYTVCKKSCATACEDTKKSCCGGKCKE